MSLLFSICLFFLFILTWDLLPFVSHFPYCILFSVLEKYRLVILHYLGRWFVSLSRVWVGSCQSLGAPAVRNHFQPSSQLGGSWTMKNIFKWAGNLYEIWTTTTVSQGFIFFFLISDTAIFAEFLRGSRVFDSGSLSSLAFSTLFSFPVLPLEYFIQLRDNSQWYSSLNSSPSLFSECQSMFRTFRSWVQCCPQPDSLLFSPSYFPHL